MNTIVPSPSLHSAPSNDSPLFFELFDAVAVWGWEWVLAEMSEVARVRGDREVEEAMVVASSGLAGNSDIDIDELVMQGQPGVKNH